MRMIAAVATGIAGIVAVAALFFVLYGRARTWELLTGPNDPGRYDFTEMPRRPTGNDALACSQGLCKAPDFELPTYDLPSGELIARLATHFPQIGWHGRRIDDGSIPAYARFLVFSPVMRFPDAIDIEAVPLPDGRTACASIRGPSSAEAISERTASISSGLWRASVPDRIISRLNSAATLAATSPARRHSCRRNRPSAAAP